jgi:dipeptidyl aminopeptidase/acylaminoacyl peptidase
MDEIADHFPHLNRHPAVLFVAFLAGLLACGLAPRFADAQPDTTRWTPALTMQYDQIADTEISPDGNRVAYVVREAVMDKTTSTFRRHIHVAAVDGRSNVQFTYGEHSNWTPKWSPSGDRLAFLSTRGGRPQVYVMRLRGGEAYAITDAETGVQGFEWGPEGERIAYRMTDPKSKAEKQREKQKRDVNVVNEEFRYAHLYTTEVKLAGDTTRTVQRLTEGTFHVTGFDWAPDGDTIVFSHRPTPRINSYLELDLSTVPADSGAVVPLVERAGWDMSPRYSPDGDRVAFVSMGGERAWEFLGDVFTVPAEGGDPTALARTPNRNATLIGWASRGEGLLVRDVAGTSTRVYAVPSDGDSARAVTSDEGLYEAFSYSRSTDRLALTYQNSTTPAEVYVGRRQNFDPKKITRIQKGVPRPKMGRTELVNWTGPDGQEIEALLTYPVDYDGGRVPLVLVPHGGPASTHLRSFTGGWRIPYMAIFNPQVFAERGYAVLRPNPRGSDGYGKAFRLVASEDYAFRPFEDLMTGVDKAVEMGVAHPDSLVVAGGSYGGYMTAWAVTHTDRFKAASMTSGISNLISQTGITDIPDHKVAMMGGEIWERSETYERYSPIYHVKNASTPTQVLHGTEDERVPPAQGRAFYRALKRRGVPTEMILYPRMPHFPREPKQLVDMTPRMLDWFDEHLGRDSGATSEASPGQ